MSKARDFLQQTFTGATGKLKGLKGKGTFKGTLAADNSGTFEVEGEFLLAGAR